MGIILDSLNSFYKGAVKPVKEINDAQDQDIGRIYLMLSSAQIFSDGNERIIEDFQDLVDINMADIAVSGLDAGATVLTAESLNGIRLGGTYMLTDGRVQEYVTVQSISCGESLQVSLVNAITQTYVNGTASLKRTTAEITTHLKDGHATGTDSTLSMSWLPQRSWKGLVTAESTSMLPTSQGSAAQFSLSGEMAFSAAGEATLAFA